MIVGIAVPIVVGAAFLLPKYHNAPSAGIASEVTASEPVPPPLEVRTHEIVADDTFTSVLESLGISYADALEILEVSKDVYNFTNVRIGKTMSLELTSEGQLGTLRYEPNSSTMISVVKAGDTWTAHEEEIKYDIEVVRASGTIESSLYLAGLVAGMSEGAIIILADTFAWSVDFATQVRGGDTFEVAYEKRSRNGKDAGTGRVLTASFTNAGDRHEAYLFEMDGKDGYYDENGTSLVRQFLKAPLSYSRITSGYTTARFHPVLAKTTPHRAIDYAAATGTPVMATADGIISSAGWNSGGYGNLVTIRHNSTFDTNYAHLSKFGKGIKRGVAVVQGQVIGYVGSTGFSTGPHLHYEIIKDGTKVNPLQIQLPAGDPIPDDQRAGFEASRDEQKKLLSKITTSQSGRGNL